MAERFLELERGDRADILQSLAAQLGRTAVVLEKDVWVCWTLGTLFALPAREAMAFKGGTSLSKVYGAIARFSEDLDVTIDCRRLAQPFDPFDPAATVTAQKRHGQNLVDAMERHVREVVAPGLAAELARQFQGACRIELDAEAEKLWVRYESALPPALGYLERNILVEFGGRNSVEPRESRTIEPYMGGLVDGVEFPVAKVDVLRPERTFWEKATLIHAECGRGELRPSRERLTRHWYDLARLADHDIGRRALADRALLVDVVRFKKVFYRAGYANYDACASGGLRLVPGAAMLATPAPTRTRATSSTTTEAQRPTVWGLAPGAWRPRRSPRLAVPPAGRLTPSRFDGV